MNYFSIFIFLVILTNCYSSNDLSVSPLTSKHFIYDLFETFKIKFDFDIIKKLELRTITRCHQKTSTIELECGKYQKIRMIESYYGVAANGASKNYCNDTYADYMNSSEDMDDCKSYTDFQNACNGRASCSINFFETYLPQCSSNSNYLTVLHECVPGKISIFALPHQ
jgi:hypothetical protein